MVASGSTVNLRSRALWEVSMAELELPRGTVLCPIGEEELRRKSRFQAGLSSPASPASISLCLPFPDGQQRQPCQLGDISQGRNQQEDDAPSLAGLSSAAIKPPGPLP